MAEKHLLDSDYIRSLTLTPSSLSINEAKKTLESFGPGERGAEAEG